MIVLLLQIVQARQFRILNAWTLLEVSISGMIYALLAMHYQQKLDHFRLIQSILLYALSVKLLWFFKAIRSIGIVVRSTYRSIITSLQMVLIFALFIAFLTAIAYLKNKNEVVNGQSV